MIHMWNKTAKICNTFDRKSKRLVPSATNRLCFFGSWVLIIESNCYVGLVIILCTKVIWGYIMSDTMLFSSEISHYLSLHACKISLFYVVYRNIIVFSTNSQSTPHWPHPSTIYNIYHSFSPLYGKSPLNGESTRCFI